MWHLLLELHCAARSLPPHSHLVPISLTHPPLCALAPPRAPRRYPTPHRWGKTREVGPQEVAPPFRILPTDKLSVTKGLKLDDLPKLEAPERMTSVLPPPLFQFFRLLLSFRSTKHEIC